MMAKETLSGPQDCYNKQVALYAEEVSRYIQELIKSTSSGINEFMPGDLKRLRSYLDAMEGYIERMKEQAQVDRPQTHAELVQVAPAPVIPNMESLLVQEAVHLLLVAREELVHSVSRRLPQGITAFDEERQTEYIKQSRLFLDEYVVKFTPQDMADRDAAEPMTSIE